MKTELFLDQEIELFQHFLSKFICLEKCNKGKKRNSHLWSVSAAGKEVREMLPRWIGFLALLTLTSAAAAAEHCWVRRFGADCLLSRHLFHSRVGKLSLSVTLLLLKCLAQNFHHAALQRQRWWEGYARHQSNQHSQSLADRPASSKLALDWELWITILV